MANTPRNNGTANQRRQNPNNRKPVRRKKKKSADTYLYIGVFLVLIAILLVAAIICVSVGCGSTEENSSVAESSVIQSENSKVNSDVPDIESAVPESSEPAVTGWAEENGSKVYYNEDGTLATGMTEIDGEIYVFEANGSMVKNGWHEVGNARYYLGEDGKAQKGWISVDGNKYYLQSDGTAAVGKTVIEGKNHYFSSNGIWFYLANPWNEVPDDDVDLVSLPKGYGEPDRGKVDRSCYDDLMQMLDDCYNTTGKDVYVISGHRTYEYQQNNYNRQVSRYLNQGYGQAEAEKLAAEWVAVPGTSEHHLGLAVDIIDTQIWDLVEEQENLEGQKWLMENSWKYGFILRYPKGTKEETGINYEPWHYRYLGKEIAKEVYDSGLTLEKYIESLTIS